MLIYFLGIVQYFPSLFFVYFFFTYAWRHGETMHARNNMHDTIRVHGYLFMYGLFFFPFGYILSWLLDFQRLHSFRILEYLFFFPSSFFFFPFSFYFFSIPPHFLVTLGTADYIFLFYLEPMSDIQYPIYQEDWALYFFFFIYFISEIGERDDYFLL